jgi:hypothetical protein
MSSSKNNTNMAQAAQHEIGNLQSSCSLTKHLYHPRTNKTQHLSESVTAAAPSPTQWHTHWATHSHSKRSRTPSRRLCNSSDSSALTCP